MQKQLESSTALAVQPVVRRCKVEAEVYGQSYTFAAETEPEYIRQLAREVDERMRSVAQSNPDLGPMRVALLALLGLAADVQEVEAAIDKQQQNIAHRCHELEREFELLLGVA